MKNKVGRANITHGKGYTCNMHSSFVVNDVLRSSVIITAYDRGLISVTNCLDSKSSYHTSIHTVQLTTYSCAEPLARILPKT